MSSYQITLAEAVDYLYNFNQNSDLLSIAQNTAFGGTFAAPTLPTDPDKGLMFWFNWIDTVGANQFFLAYQTYDDQGDGIRMELPVLSADLRIPDETFLYSPVGTSKTDIENFILNHDTKIPPQSTLTSQASVQGQTQDFLDHFPSGTENRLNIRPHIFYSARSTGSDFADLLSQSGAAGLRYYFGLEPKMSFINQIRIILVAVDSNGKNILSGSGTCILLQKGSP